MSSTFDTPLVSSTPGRKSSSELSVPYVEFFVTGDARFTESIKLAQSVHAERTTCAVMTAAEFAVFLKSP